MIKKILAIISGALLKYCSDKDLESETIRRELLNLYLSGKINAPELLKLSQDLDL